jgi:hypothetical protein
MPQLCCNAVWRSRTRPSAAITRSSYQRPLSIGVATWTLLSPISKRGTSTPDKPVLLVEIKTNQCRALERAIQATLETRGRKIAGGGTEWFKASRDEVLAIYDFISQGRGS